MLCKIEQRYWGHSFQYRLLNSGWPAIKGYTGDTGICWGDFSYWDYSGVHDFLSTILGETGIF